MAGGNGHRNGQPRFNGQGNGQAGAKLNGHGKLNGQRRVRPGSNGRPNGSRKTLGVIDYTLAKRALLREARRGVLSIFELCDAHPELLRAARHVGMETARPCPVCGREQLRLLAYVFADDLKRDNGRVWALDRALALAAARKGGACYVVEVCTGCAWNHLSEAFVARSAG